MPGIVGIVSSSDVVNIARLLNQMCEAIKHDDDFSTEHFINGPIGIGKVVFTPFYKIIKPLLNSNHSSCCMIWGEIYDCTCAKDLLEKIYQNTSDVEQLILNLYQTYGKEFVRKLKGSFVIVIWDNEKKQLLIVNDRYGLRPLYYAKRSGYLLLASEIKAILRDASFDRKLNDAAVVDFLSFEYMLGNKTLFQGIYALPPASIFIYSNGNISIEQYWDFNFIDNTELSKDYYSERLALLLRKAVERATRGNSRVGLYLSGGLDSRSVLAATDKDLSTFTFGVKGSREGKIAAQVAKQKHVENHFIELKEGYIARFAEKEVYLTDGMQSVLHSHIASVIDDVKELTDVALDGLALDLTLGGSYLYKDIVNADRKDLPRIIYKKINSIFTDDMLSQLFIPEYYQKVKGNAYSSVKEEFAKINDKTVANASDHFMLQNRVRRFTFQGAVCSRSKIEVRNPTYDYDFMDFLLTIPIELRTNHKLYLHFLPRLDKDLARLPHAKTGIRADAPEILRNMLFYKTLFSNRFIFYARRYSHGIISLPDKSGYPDFDELIRKDPATKNFVLKTLITEETWVNFNKTYIRKLIDDHLNYRGNYSRQIYVLVTFELWRRLFLSNER